MRSQVVLAALVAALALPSASLAARDRPFATPETTVRGLVAALPALNFGALWPYIDYEAGHYPAIDAILDGSTCVSIRDVRVKTTFITDEEAIADIDLDGMRMKANGEEEPLHNMVATLKRIGDGWLIVGCASPEVYAGDVLIAAASDGDRECVLERTPLDPAAIVRAGVDDIPKHRLMPLWDFCTAWARAHHDVATESDCDRSASIDLLMMGRRDDAIATADEAIELARESGDADLIAKAIFTRGLAFWRSGQPERGTSDLDACAQMLPKLRNTRIALKSLAMVLYIEAEQGDYRRSLIADERLHRLSTQEGWAEGVGVAMWHIGDIQEALRNFESAGEYHLKTYAYFRRLGDIRLSERALGDYAFDEMSLGNFDEAEHLFWRIDWALSDKYVVAEMIACFTAGHRYDQLERVLDSVPPDLMEGEPAITAQVSTARATLAFHRHRLADAERTAREALARSVAPGSTVHWPPWPAQLLLGRTLQAEGHTDAAAAAYRDAITTIEHESDSVPGDELERMRYFGDKIEPYRALADLLARHHDAAAALAVAESVRARGLREVLADGKIDIRRDLTADERTHEAALEEQVSTLGRKYVIAPRAQAATMRREVDRARSALADYQALLGVRHATLRNVTRPRTADVVAVASRLTPGEMVVEYMAGPEQTLAFLITRGGVTVRVLPATQAKLEALANRFATALERRDMRYVPVSRAIYDAVIAPLEPEIGRHREICFIPDGALWRVPFEALRDPHGAYLIDRATVSYAPSLLILSETRRVRPQRDLPRLLALGDPAIGSSAVARVRSIGRDASLGSLPEAAEEVQRIRSMYGKRSRAFTGGAARETTVKQLASGFRVIHIAAHGFVEDRSPLYSCVVLAPDDRDDGLLEMREVVDMKLNADLVVLSSCDTARGKIAPGEGVVGLAWAFLAAGCPSTVVSQWKVDSAATEQLMVAFHRRLVRNGLRDKAAALRAAKLALRRDPRYRHPYYWAPFIVVGSGM